MSNLITVGNWVIDVERVIGKFCIRSNELYEVIGFFGNNSDTNVLLENIKTGELKDIYIAEVTWNLTDEQKKQVKAHLRKRSNYAPIGSSSTQERARPVSSFFPDEE